MIIDGKKIRDKILEELKEKIHKNNLNLKLGIIVVGQNPVIEKFVHFKKETAKKLGVDFLEFRFNEDEENLENKILEKIQEIKNQVNGLVVQLPLPKNINTEKILKSIPENLDVDLLSGKIKSDEILAPVTGAVWEILKRNQVVLEDKIMVIVGKGKLVGLPTYEFFKNKVKEIILVDSKTEKPEEEFKKADILISGAGIPNLIKKENLKNDVILIDAGTSTENKKIVGDIDYSCEEKAKIFSRTPNGVGPITIAILFKNLILLSEK